MAEIDLKEFQERLRSHANQPDDPGRRGLPHEGCGARRSHGVARSFNAGRRLGTGKRGKRVFCKFDPKPQVPHVGADVPGASESELMRAGRLHRPKDARAWVDIVDMRGAKVLEPLIARAYAAASSSRSEKDALHTK